ncbi:NlpC/P60 family protein [Nocardioides sp. MAH-18]|uniref:NlpC/P60 family protein n=1 Tax=Nocardioides agri TaxID=2682843 RepID=A0A6L6XWY1_9ACTN|nr:MULTISPECIES: C40 family peptidase [unclassified Nocardioides]MBA2956110.1 C40 family peptidase [Nocardioides sp. CGMCC 1.13656]MVQ50956.1 NlpC/P60 family protein [Nocardioides sp. MAH-18]
MSAALPRITHACARVACAGALAIGLLTSAPTADARAATASSVDRATATHTAERVRKPRRDRTRHRVDPVAKAMSIAAAQKGDPYGYGATGPNRFDCSGLVLYSFRKAGFRGIPRTSSAQAGWARHVPRARLRRGDLVFFTSGGHVYHVGVFAGRKNGHPQVLHSPYPGARVRTERIWTGSWFGGTVRGRR